MRRRSGSGLQFFVFLFILLFLVATGVTVFSTISQNALSGGPLWPVPKSATLSAQIEPETELRKIIENDLEGADGTYAVVVKDFKTGEKTTINGDRVFVSASVYKLWVMGAVYEQVKEGNLNLDDPIVADVPALNDYFEIASESAELTEGALQFTVESALYQMITISHNYAALALMKKVGLENINVFLNDNQIFNTKVGGGPTTTANDVALFLEKLYQGKLVSAEASQKMIATMLDQKKTDRIPADLPEGVRVAHKTGELEGNAHDAGIVFAPYGDYLIVLLSNSDFPPGAMDRMARISRSVYDYFSAEKD